MKLAVYIVEEKKLVSIDDDGMSFDIKVGKKVAEFPIESNELHELIMNIISDGDLWTPEGFVVFENSRLLEVTKRFINKFIQEHEEDLMLKVQAKELLNFIAKNNLPTVAVKIINS